VTDSADYDDLVTIDQVIARARQSIEPGPYEWGAAGAGRGVTTTRNSIALNRLALLPRVLRDVSKVDTNSHRIGLGAGGGHRTRPTFLPDLSDG
jgi:hypothetical protein